MGYKEIQLLADWIKQERERGVDDWTIVNHVLSALLQWLEDHEDLASEE